MKILEENLNKVQNNILPGSIAFKLYSSSSFSEITDLLDLEEVKCLGETGLDFYRDYSTPEQQLVSFEAHIEVAINKKVPLFLHEREAHKKFVEVITPYMESLPNSVVHCFTGNKDALLKYLDMGCFIGITGWLCDERRGKHLEELIPLIPLEKLMIETDAPYLLPRDMGIDNSSRNEPKYLPHIAKRISELRKESIEPSILFLRKRLLPQSLFYLHLIQAVFL